ncbi:hypothetical protein VNI00_004288 [Paramarasmius palmivorus]|uniref:Zn(2)-C6 fungal-type domain-containing protein n=1 Tax=Paramarasmius palmivorus TaxID=297713 RepID=A0AAW0DNY6_9AGAR
MISPIYPSITQDKCGSSRPRLPHLKCASIDSARVFTPRSGTFGVQDDPHYATEVDRVNGGVMEASTHIYAFTGSENGKSCILIRIEAMQLTLLPVFSYDPAGRLGNCNLAQGTHPSQEEHVNKCQLADSSLPPSNTGYQTPNRHGTTNSPESKYRGSLESVHTRSQPSMESSQLTPVEYVPKFPECPGLWNVDGSNSQTMDNTSYMWSSESSCRYDLYQATPDQPELYPSQHQHTGILESHYTSPYPYVAVDPSHSWPSPASSSSEEATPNDRTIPLPSSWYGSGYNLSSQVFIPPPAIPIPSVHPQNGMRTSKKALLACLFCRERKIACGRPSIGSADMTCK